MKLLTVLFKAKTRQTCDVKVNSNDKTSLFRADFYI